MIDGVGAVLAQRRSRPPATGRGASIAAVLLHVLAGGGVGVLPLLRAEPETTPDFRGPVLIVPAATLGVREPPPAPLPRQESTPGPPAEPEPPEPEPALPTPDRSPPPAPTTRTPPVARPEAQPIQRQGLPTGRSTGTATFGAAVAGLDNPNFRYSYYVDQMLAMISAAWVRPPIGGDIESIVSFRIRRDGSITDPRIAQSSGFSSFDLAALRAVQQAAPFPRLPQTYKEDSLGVNLIVH